MKLSKIDGHTIALDLLTKGKVIDLGCRNFQFAKAMSDMGHQVFAFDADPSIFCGAEDMIIETTPIIYASNKAVGIRNGTTTIFTMGEGSFTSEVNPTYGNKTESFEVELIDYKEITNREYDVLKIDIEGGEYEILSDPNFLPLPKQITVEFHEHTHKELHDKMFEACLKNLNKHYELMYIFEDNEFKYMDCLFVRR